MKPLFAFVFTLLTCCVFAQSFKKIPVGNSGCSIYTYCDIKFTVEKSTDSSLVYTGECINDEVSYGIICVKLLTPVTDLTMAEDLLIAYLDYLKESFGITKAAGYGKGHQLNDNERTRGILDYWVDNDKDSWKVIAWTDGKFIGVMYAYSIKPLPESKINTFLDSFRLPESR
ncbi:MAG: hypothetical protein ABIR30_05505 [Chitinophagaceae bacterium]